MVEFFFLIVEFLFASVSDYNNIDGKMKNKNHTGVKKIKPKMNMINLNHTITGTKGGKTYFERVTIDFDVTSD